MDLQNPTSVIGSAGRRYKVRFRFRIGARLDISRKVYPFSLEGHRGKIMSENPDEIIREAQWLVVIVTGFISEDEAKKFGLRLKRATSVAAVIWRIGIDVGEDRASSWISPLIKSDLFNKHGVTLLDNVHGIMVYPTDIIATMHSSSATFVSYSRGHEEINDVASLFGKVALEDRREYQAALLMNAAMINSEPLASMVLAVSAVELLSKGKGWTDAQKNSLSQIMNIVNANSYLLETEKNDLLASLERLSRQSITAGITQLLTSLNLIHLKPQWDLVYKHRSTVFHARRYITENERNYNVQEVMSVCGRIVFAALAAQHPGAIREYDVIHP